MYTITTYWCSDICNCFSPVWRKKSNNGIFSASVEEISDSDSQFSFSNEESSSMHVSILRNLSILLNLTCWRQINDVIFAYVQDANEAEAENTDKEGDFNLKVSDEQKIRSPRYILISTLFLGNIRRTVQLCLYFV